MGLNITPTSGDAPYTLSIDLLNPSLIDGVNYDLLARFSSSTGNCPVPAAAPSQVVRDALLSQGYYIRTIVVVPGDCGVYKIDIIDLDTSTTISTQSVSIDNIE